MLPTARPTCTTWSTPGDIRGPLDVNEVSALGALDAAVSDEIERDLQRVLGDLLARAQAVGAVRADVETTDVMALIPAALSAPDRLLPVVRDGLRAAARRPRRSPASGAELAGGWVVRHRRQVGPATIRVDAGTTQ